MSDDTLIEAVAKAMSESGNKDWMYADDWLKDIYIGQAIAALAVCRPIIEAPFRAENEKLRAALEAERERCYLAAVSTTCNVEETADYYSGYCDGVQDAAAALKDSNDV